MTSVVDICNLALAKVRGGSINSLTEASVQAQQCALHYPLLRDMVLDDAPWQFAHATKPLSLLSLEIFNWSYAYQYPTDCHRINRLVAEYEEIDSSSDGTMVSRLRDDQLRSQSELRAQIPYEVFNVSGVKVIGSNEPNLRIDYRGKVEDPTLFSPPFVIALAHLLASEIAIPIAGGEMGMQFRSDALQLYQKYIGAALASDMNEQYHDPLESEFITIRR